MNIKGTFILLLITITCCINASEHTPITSSSEISSKEVLDDILKMIQLKEAVATSQEQQDFDNASAKQNQSSIEFQKELNNCYHQQNCVTSQELKTLFFQFCQAKQNVDRTWNNLQNSNAQTEITTIQKKYQNVNASEYPTKKFN